MAGGTISAGQAEAEKKLAHYKRLILQSRQMLEAYQKQLAEKDKGLEELKQRAARSEAQAKKALLQHAEMGRQLTAAKEAAQANNNSKANGGGSGGNNSGGGSSSSSGGGGSQGQHEKPRVPLKARRRVDDRGGIWVLFDFPKSRRRRRLRFRMGEGQEEGILLPVVLAALLQTAEWEWLENGGASQTRSVGQSWSHSSKQ